MMLRVTYLLLALIALVVVGYTHATEHGGVDAAEVVFTAFLAMLLLDDFVRAIHATVEDS